MKKIVILIIMLSMFTCETLKAINNPASVSKFYSGLESLGKASNVNIANATQQNMAACFMAGDQSGINLSMDGLGEMSSSLYTMKLFMMIFNERSLKINKCDITHTEIVEQPDQNSTMQKKGAQHYVTYVTKQYIKDGKITTYNDIVFTLISNGLIVEMENSESSGTMPIPKPTEELNVEQLRARAAYYYSKGRYTEAYNYYEQLVKRSPTDGDAYYRIALMTFWRKGCKERFTKKVARNKAMEYIDLAIKYAKGDIGGKAMNVRDNWNNNNIYF